MTITLSDKEAKVLVAAQLQANASSSTLQAAAGLPDHVVRRSLRRLIECNIAVPKALINVNPIGFDKTGVFFSLGSSEPTTRQQALDFLGQLPHVVSLYELCGEYEYFAVIASRGAMALAAILGEIAEAAPCFQQIAVSTRVSLSLYQRTYLADPLEPRTFVRYHHTDEEVQLAREDVAVLQGLDLHGVLTPAGLARAIGQPASSVAYRLARLERQRVVCGYLLHFRPETLGISTHHILVACRANGPKMAERLHQFCLGEPNVVVLAQCLGNWQYELRAETRDSNELAMLCVRLKRALGQDLVELKTHMLVQELRYMRSSFLWEIQQPAGSSMLCALDVEPEKKAVS